MICLGLWVSCHLNLKHDKETAFASEQEEVEEEWMSEVKLLQARLTIISDDRRFDLLIHHFSENSLETAGYHAPKHDKSKVRPADLGLDFRRRAVLVLSARFRSLSREGRVALVRLLGGILWPADHGAVCVDWSWSVSVLSLMHSYQIKSI